MLVAQITQPSTTLEIPLAQATQPSTALQRANASFIHYPRLDDLHRMICRCQRISKESTEPQCMALQGESGTGKTTLVRDVYAAVFLRIETPDGTIIPVLYVEVPSPATVKDAVSDMLEALGDPDAHSGTIGALNSRLVGLIKDCQVELVILDEFSNLIDADTDHILKRVSDWLKMLIKKTKIPFLVVGIDGKVERILNANKQLSRLFAMRETLEPFVWNINDPETIKTFNTFVTSAEKSMGKPLPKDIDRVDLMYRIFYATRGVVGNVMNLMREAVALADEQNRATLDLPLLSQAFEGRLAKHVKVPVNPFLAKVEAKFAEPLSPEPTPETGKTDRRRKKKAPSLDETLKTK